MGLKYLPRRDSPLSHLENSVTNVMPDIHTRLAYHAETSLKERTHKVLASEKAEGVMDIQTATVSGTSPGSSSRLLTAGEVAQRLNVKISWVKEHTRTRCPKEQRIPCIRLGRMVRFNEREIDCWIENGCKVLDIGRSAFKPNAVTIAGVGMRQRG
jgi:excisionase family DNA binding protein